MYAQFPIDYIEPLYRPPSEAGSLILQVTNGCSWNRCSYCEMYTDTQKKFRPGNEAEILDEIRRCAEAGLQPRRVFLADGDALVLSMRRLRNILGEIGRALPSVSRVSSYCLPSNLKNKSDDDLAELRALGLQLVYVGAETGDDRLLARVDKGETHASTVEALLRARQAGIKTSVMILNGLGGKAFSRQHALESARLVNQVQPDYLATLVLTFHRGGERFEAGFGAKFEAMDSVELCQEIGEFLSASQLERSIFRSDHVSNHMVLKGVLGRDKARMLDQVEASIAWFRENPPSRPASSVY